MTAKPAVSCEYTSKMSSAVNQLAKDCEAVEAAVRESKREAEQLADRLSELREDRSRAFAMPRGVLARVPLKAWNALLGGLIVPLALFLALVLPGADTTWSGANAEGFPSEFTAFAYEASDEVRAGIEGSLRVEPVGNGQCQVYVMFESSLNVEELVECPAPGATTLSGERFHLDRRARRLAVSDPTGEFVIVEERDVLP